MTTSTNIEYYQFILMIFIGGLVAIIAKIAFAYIDTVIKKKVLEKPAIHGSVEICGDCPAMKATNERIPVIETNQDKLRKGTLLEMKEELKEIKTTQDYLVKTTDELKRKVEALHQLLQQDWMREIQELRQVIRDKSLEIKKLKHPDE